MLKAEKNRYKIPRRIAVQRQSMNAIGSVAKISAVSTQRFSQQELAESACEKKRKRTEWPRAAHRDHLRDAALVDLERGLDIRPTGFAQLLCSPHEERRQVRLGHEGDEENVFDRGPAAQKESDQKEASRVSRHALLLTPVI